jgi:crossover junction endodeoxyribonuclease RuvC
MIEPVFVLGIDPGLSRCGYAVVEQHAGQVRAIAVGVLRTDPTWDLADRLVMLGDDIRQLLAEYEPGAVAIERILFQVNVRTAIPTAQASGILMAEARRAGATVTAYSPNTVKQTVAGDGAADKDQIGRMVQRTLGLAQPLRPADAADAVAIALCHLAHAPLAGRIASASHPSAGGLVR